MRWDTANSSLLVNKTNLILSSSVSGKVLFKACFKNVDVKKIGPDQPDSSAGGNLLNPSVICLFSCAEGWSDGECDPKTNILFADMQQRAEAWPDFLFDLKKKETKDGMKSDFIHLHGPTQMMLGR